MARSAKKKSKVLIKDYDNGGLKIVYVFSYAKKLKIIWFNRHITSYCSTCYGFALKNILVLEKIVNFGKGYIELCVRQMFNPFWKDVLESFADFIDHFPIDNIKKF